jgi:hypothetical protein
MSGAPNIPPRERLTIPKCVCLNAAKQVPCTWPRCACRVDIVFKPDTQIPRPGRR